MRTRYRKLSLQSLFAYFVRWSVLSLLIGSLIGSGSAFFLSALQWVTATREFNPWIILCLPFAGFLLGYIYYYAGKGTEKGNDLVLEEFYSNQRKIPLKMAPLVVFGTLLTHLFGGSAGREGTAIQMGAALADHFQKWKQITKKNRKILLIMGMSAGFSSVFGTPLAGFVFSLEVLAISKVNYRAVFPSLLVAWVGDYVVHLWQVPHTVYSIDEVASLNLQNIGWTLIASVLFGLTAWLFIRAKFFFKGIFQRVTFPPLRPFIGGLAICIVVFVSQSTKYVGLGIPIIEASFEHTMMPYDFLLKLLLTAFTLGAGFKGGEVTPLFFMGATLGSALFLLLPLPLPLLAGMGFVAVFAAATNTPLASVVMGMELFGVESGLFIALACVTSYLISGSKSVYGSQKTPITKQFLYRILNRNARF